MKKRGPTNIDEIIKLLTIMKDSIVPEKDVIIRIEKDLSSTISKLSEVDVVGNDVLQSIKKIQEDIKGLKDDLKEIKDNEKKFRYILYFLTAISVLIPFLLKTMGK